MPRLCLALLLFWLTSPSWALPPAPLDSDDLRLSLGSYTGYYEDVGGQLSVDQALALDDDAFRRIEGEHANQCGRCEDRALPLPDGAKKLGEVDIDIMLIAVHTRHYTLPVHLAREGKGSW
mgnify:CR=1 FL=1